MTARERHCRRRGRTSSWIRPVKRLAIYLRDDFQCQYCGRKLNDAPAREVTLDHLECQVDHPTGKLPNGHSVHDESNLVTACLACNSGRSARVRWHRYATPGAKARIQRNRRRKLNLSLARAVLEGRVNRAELRSCTSR